MYWWDGESSQRAADRTAAAPAYDGRTAPRYTTHRSAVQPQEDPSEHSQGMEKRISLNSDYLTPILCLSMCVSD